jgi:uncharacterized membrane protein
VAVAADEFNVPNELVFSLTHIFVCVLVLVPLLAMVVAQESAQEIAKLHHTAIFTAVVIAPAQFIVAITVQSGFFNAHHKYKSFSQYILQVAFVNGFILIDVIVPVIADALGVNINPQTELALK